MLQSYYKVQKSYGADIKKHADEFISKCYHFSVNEDFFRQKTST